VVRGPHWAHQTADPWSLTLVVVDLLAERPLSQLVRRCSHHSLTNHISDGRRHPCRSPPKSAAVLHSRCWRTSRRGCLRQSRTTCAPTQLRLASTPLTPHQTRSPTSLQHPPDRPAGSWYDAAVVFCEYEAC